MRTPPRLLALVSLVAAAPLATAAPAPAPAPGFIIILADDLGWGDLGCQGNPHVRTPHLDALAREGVRFTQAYAPSPVCSASRAALLTGQWPARLGITDAIGDAGDRWNRGRRLRTPPNPGALDLATVTLAETLRPAGFATASIGKWHLGGKGSLAEDHGFEVNYYGNNLGSPKTMFGPDHGLGLAPTPPGEYLTDRLQDEAERWLAAQGERPFLLLLSHFAVHRPLGAKEETIRRQPARGPAPWGLLPEYAAMIEDLDATVGRLRAFLAARGLDRRTTVVFTSDNGAVKWWGSNGGLRETKGTLYEGGIRVPLIVRQPGGASRGRVLDVPVHGIDLFPTLLDLAGAGPGPAVDGRSLATLLRGGRGPAADRPLFWHFPHDNMHGARPAGAVRAGDLKLLEFLEDGRRELYDLQADPGETTDLSTRRPADVRRLADLLAAHRREVGARMPEPNPAFDGTEPEVVPLRPFESTRTVPGGR